MSKYSHFLEQAYTAFEVTHRERGVIPNCIKAYDIFVMDKDGYLTIKNPAPKYQGNQYLT